MSQLKLISRFRIDHMNVTDNIDIVNYIYKESVIQSNSHKIDGHPLTLICNSIENTFNVNGTRSVDIKLNEALIEVYVVNDLDELTISRVKSRLMLLIEKLLYGQIVLYYS